MVLQAQQKPAWLAEDAPQVDVVLSSRTRVMRNLAGHRFPHAADINELQEVMRKILRAAKDSSLELEVYKGLTNAERDYLVACRLVSPDFEWTLPARALLMDADRSASLLVNEEDHLRVQTLSAGWSVSTSDSQASAVLGHIENSLKFAYAPGRGFLAASPFNCGLGRRQSAMFHLIGLANAKRLPSVMKALSAKGIVVRGLFGEASRAVGAFVQVSYVRGTREDFVGACEYLLREERGVRSEVPRDQIEERAVQAGRFAVTSRSVTLPDALRVLAWNRWAATAGLVDISPRSIDEALTVLELRGGHHEDEAAKDRAATLRNAIGVS
jgi:protein arginine kinase